MGPGQPAGSRDNMWQLVAPRRPGAVNGWWFSCLVIGKVPLTPGQLPSGVVRPTVNRDTMTAVAPSTLENAARPHLPAFRIAGYAAGDAGCNIAFQMTGLFLLIFYTNVVGISPTQAGSIFLTFIIWITLATVIVQFLTAPFVPALVTRFGKKNLFQYCGLFTVIGGVGLFFVPGNLWWLAMLCIAVKGFGVSFINTLMFALEADTVEYGEWKTGQRTEGASYSIFSFTRKITQSIGGALGAFALALGGYITKLAADQVQPDSAITAIKAAIGLVPATAAILGMIAFIAYPLTEKKYREIVAENDTRKQKFLEQHNIATVPIPPVI